MKFEKREDDSVGSLVSVKRSSSRRRRPSKSSERTKRRGSKEQASVRRAANETPDEIFDMVERYNRSDLGSHSDTRDDCEGSFEERVEVDEERSNAAKGAPKEDSYILDLIEKLQLKEVLQNMPGNSGAASDNESEVSGQLRGYKARLLQEEKKSAELSSQLERMQERWRQDIQEKDELIASLEVRCSVQERAFKERLQAEHAHVMSLQERLLNERDYRESLEREFSSDRSVGLEEHVRELTKQVQDLQGSKAALEASLEARQNTYDYYMTSASAKIQELEQSQAEKIQSFEAERAQIKKLELTVAKTEAILELDRKKLKTVQLSEARTQVLLEAEKKRAEALEKLNAKMKTAMRKLNKKATILDGAQGQISSLSKELERRDLMISSIKTLLRVNPESQAPAPVEESTTKPRSADDFLAYAREFHPTMEVPFNKTQSDTSSCTEPSSFDE